MSGFSPDKLQTTSGDFDGDGSADLAVLDTGKDQVFVFDSILQLGNQVTTSQATSSLSEINSNHLDRIRRRSRIESRIFLYSNEHTSGSDWQT